MKKCKTCIHAIQTDEHEFLCGYYAFDIKNKSCYKPKTACGSQQGHYESNSTTALNSAFDFQSRFGIILEDDGV